MFRKKIILDNEMYHKIFDFIFTTEGKYLGIYQKDSAYTVETQAIHPDEILCCCCLSCCRCSNIAFD